VAMVENQQAAPKAAPSDGAQKQKETH
jgi:hypothetical protein